jgi:hypothetical protein
MERGHRERTADLSTKEESVAATLTYATGVGRSVGIPVARIRQSAGNSSVPA